MKGSKEKRRRLTFMSNTDCSLVTLIQASGVLCPHKIHNYSSGLLQLGLPAPASLWKTYVLATGSFCLLCPLIHLLILVSITTSSVGKAGMAEGQTGPITQKSRIWSFHPLVPYPTCINLPHDFGYELSVPWTLDRVPAMCKAHIEAAIVSR